VDIGKAVDLSRFSIHGVMNGKRSVSLELLLRIGIYLDMPGDQIIDLWKHDQIEKIDKEIDRAKKSLKKGKRKTKKKPDSRGL
jgi:plasmid maintenance system antidote protein VapI